MTILALAENEKNYPSKSSDKSHWLVFWIVYGILYLLENVKFNFLPAMSFDVTKGLLLISMMLKPIQQSIHSIFIRTHNTLPRKVQDQSQIKEVELWELIKQESSLCEDIDLTGLPVEKIAP